jgi:GWxTD domain-containing protein
VAVRLSLIVLTLSLVVPPPCHAQEEPGRGVIARLHIEDGLARAASGDTAAALAQFRQAVEVAPRLAQAHFQLGRLLARYASTVETDFRERVEAERALREAIALDPYNPAYHAELGILFIKQHMRIDGERVLNRALEMAEERRLELDPALLADVHFNLGWVHEISYERWRDRRLTPLYREAIPATLPWSDRLNRYVDAYLEDARPIENAGQATRDVMLEHYWTALRNDPTHFDASRRLLVHLLEDGQFSEYLSVARRLVEAHPDRPAAGLYLGLGLHVAGRENEAAAAFERALARLPERERAPLLSIEPLLRRKRAEDYLLMDDSSRTEYEHAFWRLTDRLYLTEANETRLEHMARVAYADLRFAEPATGRRGWETEAGSSSSATGRQTRSPESARGSCGPIAPGPCSCSIRRPGTSTRALSATSRSTPTSITCVCRLFMATSPRSPAGSRFPFRSPASVAARRTRRLSRSMPSCRWKGWAAIWTWRPVSSRPASSCVT